MRLIDADLITEKQICHYLGRYASCCEDVVDLINDQSTVHAEKVRHGNWRLIWNVSCEPMEKRYECDQCNSGYVYKRPFAYCPDCGAKMSEEQNETN